MDFGFYKVILEDENGRREVVLNAEIRAPVGGDWIDVDGRWYVIKLATHAQTDDSNEDVRGLVVFAVPVEPLEDGTPGPIRGGTVTPFPRGGSNPTSEHSSSSRGLRVLPFNPPPTAACAYFPASLVLTLVACAYQEQRIQAEMAKFESWKLIHSDSHWLLKPVTCSIADDLRASSREALFQFRVAEGFILRDWPAMYAVDDPSINVFDLETYRRTKTAAQTKGRG